MKPAHTIGSSRIYLGDSAAVLVTLPEKSVHCSVTSPPYYALRDYKVKGQIGLEDTPQQYIDRLVAVFRELRRVLRDDGTLWVNIADSYSSGDRTGHGTRQGYKQKTNRGMSGEADPPRAGQPAGMNGQQLLGIPWKFAEAMRADGWLLRSEITWVKLSAMPESVAGWRWERCRVKVKDSKDKRGKEKWGGNACTSPQGDHRLGVIDGSAEWSDCPGCKKCLPNGGLVLRKGAWRPTRATESIFLFAKTDRYYCDGEAVKNRARDTTVMRDRYSRVLEDPDEQFAVKHDHESDSGGTANLRNWVLFKGEPLKEGHYAAYPSGLPRLAIMAGTSRKGVCPHCGAPWARVIIPDEDTKKAQEEARNGQDWTARGYDNSAKRPQGRKSGDKLGGGYTSRYVTEGWRPTCTCPEHTPIPSTVLDPFLGSGTTLLVSEKGHRNGIGIDLSAEYIEIAARRIRKAHRARGLVAPF